MKTNKLGSNQHNKTKISPYFILCTPLPSVLYCEVISSCLNIVLFYILKRSIILSDYRHPQFTMIYEVAALIILSLASLTSAQHPPPPPSYQPFPPQQAPMDQTTMLMMVMMMQKVGISEFLSNQIETIFIRTARWTTCFPWS